MVKTATNPIKSRAILADATIRQWTGRRLDRRITDEVNESHNATSAAGRYNKQIILKGAFTEIARITREARTLHHTLTVPWSDNGQRVLPLVKEREFAARFRELRRQFNEAADEFTEAYPVHIEEARKNLGEMFNIDEYPAQGRVRRMFSFDVSYLPVPDHTDIRIDASAQQVEEIKKASQASIERVIGAMTQDPVERIIKAVGRMSERLHAYTPPNGDGSRAEGVFRDSLVSNVEELVALLPALNLTDDKKLKKLIERMDKQLCCYDASTLREDEHARVIVAGHADEILEQAQALMA